MKNEILPEPRRPVLVGTVFLILLMGMGGFSHLIYDPPTRRFHWQTPRVISGDEPHYLMAVKSILFDHDLEFQEDYRREEYKRLEHHTILVDPVTGEREWAVMYDARHPSMRGRPVPYCKPWDCSDPARMDPRFPDYSRIIERSAHPIAFPALIAAVLAPTRPSPSQVEGRMQGAILVACWLTAVVIYRIGRRAGLDRAMSLAAVGLLVLASPWLAYSRSFYSETVAGFFLTLGLWGMQARRPLIAALALWIAAAIKPIFILVVFSWVLERCWSREYREALILGLVLTVGGLGLSAFNYWQAKTIIIAGHLRGEQVWTTPNPFPTLLSLRWGLFVFTPWAAVAFYALIRSFWRHPQSSADLLLRQISIAVVIYCALLAAHKYSGQSCYGCRYWVPFLPWLALATIIFVSRAGRIVRTVTLIGVEASLVIAVSGALGYPFMFDKEPFVAMRGIVYGIFR